MEYTKRPVGRPEKYDPKYCQEIIDYMAQGFSKEAFAGHINVTKQIVYDWMKRHPEFLDAVKYAESKNLEFWESAGIRGMNLGKDFNDRTWKFNMQNRHHWKDKQDITTDDKPIGYPADSRLLKGGTNVPVNNSND